MSATEFSVITNTSQDGKNYQVDNDGRSNIYGNAESISPYGFTSNAPLYSYFIQLQNDENGVCGFPFNPTLTPIIKEGEVAIGNFLKGSVVYFNEQGRVNISNLKQSLFEVINTIFQTDIEIFELQNQIFTTLSTLTVVTGAVGTTSPLTPSIGAAITSKISEIQGKITTLQEKKQHLSELLF